MNPLPVGGIGPLKGYTCRHVGSSLFGQVRDFNVLAPPKTDQKPAGLEWIMVDTCGLDRSPNFYGYDGDHGGSAAGTSWAASSAIRAFGIALDGLFPI